jgi:tetratricopeptide (TPR) repeat protein
MYKLEKIAFYIVLGMSFILPLAFLSPQFLPFDMLKASIFSIGTTLALALVCVSAFRSEAIMGIKGKTTYALLAVLLSFVLSGLAVLKDAGFYKSFLGAGVETTTVLFAILSVAFIYTVVSLVRTKERFITLLSSIVLGGLVLALFHLIRFVFGADTFTFGGIFSTQITNTVGQWNDLGIYFGFLLLISYISLEFMALSKAVRVVLYGLAAVSIIFLIAIGFNAAWYGIAAVALFVGLYSRKHTKLSYTTSILFIASVLLGIFGATIAGKLSTSLDVNHLDVRPSWELSVDLANQSLQQRPFFGAGPNRFVNVYLQNKPASVNQTVFWSLDFTSGVSYVTSFIVSLGLVGSLAILWLVILVGVYMIKVYKHNTEDSVKRFSAVAGTGLTLYFIIAGFLYNPSLTVIFLGLVSFALFLVALKEENLISVFTLEGDTQRKKLIIKIITALATVLVLLGLIFFVRRALANIYFSKAVVLLNTENKIDEAEKYVNKAIAMVDREQYYQGLVEISIIKTGRLISTTKEADQKAVDALKSYLDTGITNAQNAIRLDPLNYQNYITQAHVYESVVPARVNLAYENAMKSYESAAALNPLNPAVYLLAAQLEASIKKLPEAKQFIGKALQVKNNYSDAIFLLSQIQVAENSIKDAITSLLVLAQLNPQDPTIFFQLGLLYYNSGDNVNTGIVLSKAVELSPDYSNARYFLGLAYARLGKYAEAVDQFEAVARLNPDNEEVANILTALKAGKSPFQAVTTPEKAKTPPVKDSIDKKTSTKVKTR